MENHVKFSEMLTLLDNLLVCQEDVTVQITNEIADKFISSICILIFEYVLKFSSERRKQILCKSKAQARLQLFEKDVAFDYSVTIPNELILDVNLD